MTDKALDELLLLMIGVTLLAVFWSSPDEISKWIFLLPPAQ